MCLHNLVFNDLQMLTFWAFFWCLKLLYFLWVFLLGNHCIHEVSKSVLEILISNCMPLISAAICTLNFRHYVICQYIVVIYKI
jgi:hypothetical protein